MPALVPCEPAFPERGLRTQQIEDRLKGTGFNIYYQSHSVLFVHSF